MKLKLGVDNFKAIKNLVSMFFYSMNKSHVDVMQCAFAFELAIPGILLGNLLVSTQLCTIYNI